MKDKLAKLSIQEKDEKSFTINTKLNDLVTELKSQIKKEDVSVIGLFAPLKDEVNFKEFRRLIKDKWQLSFPYSEGGSMDFRKSAFEELEESTVFGVKIKTPTEDSERVIPDILCIPGLAFDRQGTRMGRGKGFYDKYLHQFNGVKVGVCFSEQIINNVPKEDHDVLVDYVVSESGIYRAA